jgi:hypothetical protein
MSVVDLNEPFAAGSRRLLLSRSDGGCDAVDEEPAKRGRRVSGPGGAVVGHPDPSEMRELRARRVRAAR